MLCEVYKECGVRVRNHCGAEPPRDIEPPGLVTTVGWRDRASTSYAAADRVKTRASAARGRLRRIYGGRTAPSLPTETEAAAHEESVFSGALIALRLVNRGRYEIRANTRSRNRIDGCTTSSSVNGRNHSPNSSRGSTTPESANSVLTPRSSYARSHSGPKSASRPRSSTVAWAKSSSA